MKDKWWERRRVLNETTFSESSSNLIFGARLLWDWKLCGTRETVSVRALTPKKLRVEEDVRILANGVL